MHRKQEEDEEGDHRKKERKKESSEVKHAYYNCRPKAVQRAPKCDTLAITIYRSRNLDLMVTIVKIVQNVLKTVKNENNILWKIEILEKKLTLHDILTQILNNSYKNWS